MSPPPTVRHSTCVASPVYRTRSGDTSCTSNGISRRPPRTTHEIAYRTAPEGPERTPKREWGEPSAVLKLLGLGAGAVGVAHVEERLLGKIVELAVDEQFEGLDGLVDRHVDPLEAREHLTDEERLRQEPLDLAGPVHAHAVLLGELVETEDGDDVLQLLVPLQDLLRTGRHPVMAITDDFRGEDGR